MKQAVIICLILCCVGFADAAQKEENTGFRNTLCMGVTLIDGNSEALQANAVIMTENDKEELSSLRAGMEANYGESTVSSNKEITVKNLRAFTSVNKMINSKMFGSMHGEVLYDDIAQIDYRATLGPGLGFCLVKNDQMSLSVENGPSYVWEKIADARDAYLGLRFAERCNLVISKVAKVWQSLEYLPKMDDSSDYLLNAELGAEAGMNARMNLRIVLQNKYDSTPGPNLEKNNLTLIAGISIK